MDSKKLFPALFNRQELPRPLYLPLACSLAARLRQISLPEMFASPTHYANALRDAYRLFGFDALVTSFDPTLEAEALGCPIQWESGDRLPRVGSHPLAEGRGLADLEQQWEAKGRLPIVLEVTKRLVMLLSKEVAIVGAMTGPFTLAGQLRGDPFFSELREDTPHCQELFDFVGQCSLKLARLYAELKVDGLIVIEDHFNKIESTSIQNGHGQAELAATANENGPRKGSDIFTRNRHEPAKLPPPENENGFQRDAGIFTGKLSPIFQSLLNLLRYYDVPLILLAHGCCEEQAYSISSLPADGLILDVQPDQEIQSQDLCLATTIPTELLLGDSTLIGETLGNRLKGGKGIKRSFLSNDWEIPYHAPVQNIHEVMRLIKPSWPTGVGRPHE